MDVAVRAEAIESAVRSLGLSTRPVEVHVSLRSFSGALAPGTIVDAFLAAGCTVLAATMAPQFGLPAPPDDRPARNGLDYAAQDAEVPDDPRPGLTERYDASRTEVAPWLGAFSAFVAADPRRIRSRRSTGELAAIGPRARQLIDLELDADVYGPLRSLAASDGAVVLMGVGLTRMTLLHLAEIQAGRRPFIRWARGSDGETVRVGVGECSEGFERLSGTLRPIEVVRTVAGSRWRVFPAREALERAARAIQQNPQITHCANPDCLECADAVAGGPLD